MEAAWRSHTCLSRIILARVLEGLIISNKADTIPSDTCRSLQKRQDGGVVHVEDGAVYILGGNFTGNKADGSGGVWFLKGEDAEATLMAEGGHFEGNQAENGGVGFANRGNVKITRGDYSANKAGENGGAFAVEEKETILDVRCPTGELGIGHASGR